MQQRQLRLGDILDDYCPRERRVTNHAIVAMIGDAVKQTRCTTCDAEHEYKHAKIPRQRKKSETPAALYAQVAAGAPKRVAHDPDATNGGAAGGAGDPLDDTMTAETESVDATATQDAMDDVVNPDADTPPLAAHTQDDEDDEPSAVGERDDEGPVHRPLIRASLPRPEGQQPPQRPIPEFTIRQPAGRPNRFRPRHQRGGQSGFGFQGGNRANGNMPGANRGPRHGGGRPPMNKRHGPGGGGRKRSK